MPQQWRFTDKRASRYLDKVKAYIKNYEVIEKHKRQLKKLNKSFDDPITKAKPYIEVIERGDGKKTKQWSELLKKYHPLPYFGGMGRYIRFFIRDHDSDELLGCASIGSAVLCTADRDKFIGWNRQQRLRNLGKVGNNRRFLILPWVQVPNLASQVLSRLATIAKKMWRQRYGDPLVLLETFVEPPCDGTCYKASGWIFVGKTKGYMHYVPTHLKKSNGGGAEKSVYLYTGVKKKIFVKPLHRYWKRELLKN